MWWKHKLKLNIQHSFRLNKPKPPKFTSILAVITVLGGGLYGILSLTNLPAQADPIDNPADGPNFTMNPATDIAACASNSECFAFTIDTRLTSTGATTGIETTFSIPTSSQVNGDTNKSYNWIINWGDGSGDQTVSGTSYSINTAGVPHDYVDTGAGSYQIAIRPSSPTNGWLNAFGFRGEYGADAFANRYKFHSIDTPFTNLMRSNNSTYRFAYIFSNLRNGLGIPSQLFANISTVGATDLSGMFDNTFYRYSTDSTATIPAGLFSTITIPAGATNLSSMFNSTFYSYASNSTDTIPAGLFSAITIPAGATDLSNMFMGTFGGHARKSTTGIPADLFSAITIPASATNLSGMFSNTFLNYAYNSTTATIPGGLFSTITIPAGATDLSSMFEGTFDGHAYNSTTATIPADLFSTITVPTSATDLSSMFEDTFYLHATKSTTGTIPAGLFSTITIPAGATDLSSMFRRTFSYYATKSTTGTIPAGLFSTITIPAGATNLSNMFNETFYGYAQSSTTSTIPADLFTTINTSSATDLSYMFRQTFYEYARRTATFKVGASSVGTQIFNYPYATKIGPNGAPSDNPTVAAGDVIYPTYNAATRTINAPTGTYTDYSWYYKDGTSCSVGSPTPDCGPQDSTTLASFPNTTEWTPETSTEKGDVIFYGVFNLVLELNLDSNDLKIGGSAGVTPTTTGAFAYASNIATVKTNNPKGYRLDISTNTTDSNMKHLSISGANIPATNGSLTSKKALSNNTWGFTLTANPTATQAVWAAVSNLSSPLTVKSTTTPNITGDNTTINYGAKIDLTQVAGQYQTTIIYTALANP